MTERERCPDCGGSRVPFLHLRKDCPSAERPRYVPRAVTDADRIAALERVVAMLLEHIREHGLHAPARTSWPDDGLDDLPPAERLLRQQARICRRALRRIDPHHPLIDVLSRVLVPGFRAPTTIAPRPIQPPFAVWLALQRLRHVTPLDAPLARPQPGDDQEIGRLRRFVEWFARLHEQGG